MITEITEEELLLIALKCGNPLTITDAMWVGNGFQLRICFLDYKQPHPHRVDFIDKRYMEIFRISDTCYIFDNDPSHKIRPFYKYVLRKGERSWKP